MQSRGFSFLELLVALAIVLIAAALSVPLVVNFAEDRAFESGADLLVDQLLLARAAAQEQGEAVEVVYLPDQRLVLSHLFRPEEDRPDVVPSGGRTTIRDEDAGSLNQPWARRVLTGSMVLSRERPRFESQSRVEPEPAAPLRLAVFLADGSALMGEDVWLTDDRDRVGRLRVNPWTGLPRYEREVNRFEDEDEAAGEEGGDLRRAGATRGVEAPLSPVGDPSKSSDDPAPLENDR